MRRITSIYLAGPDASFPDDAALAAEKRALCETAGFVPVLSGDGFLVETEPSEAMAREIYADRVSRMRLTDAGIVNLTPFRGPSCDAGAAFEAGFLAALGKPVFAYMNVATEVEADPRERIEALIGAHLGEDGVWRDGDDCEIEDFGLPENLMLWAEARRLYVIITPDVQGDLTGLQLCLEAIKMYSD